MDHIWYNQFDVREGGILLEDSTDHMPTIALFSDIPCTPSNLTKIEFRDHLLKNQCVFVHKCSEIAWQFNADDVNISTAKFSENVNNLYIGCFPKKVKYVSVKRINKPWLTSAITKSIKNQSLFYKQSKLNLIPESYYKKFRNNLTNIIRKAKRNYVHSAFSNYKRNMKSTWKLINNLIIEKKPTHPIKSIIVNDTVIYDSSEIANRFNEFVCNIARDLDADISPPLGDPLDCVRFSDRSMYLFPVTPTEITSKISKLKNSLYGLHNIPERIFQLAYHSLCHPLSEIINHSFSSGIFPDILKVAMVTPVYKSESKSCINNYRPISVLPLISKIFEKGFSKRLIKYLDKFEILDQHQFGFQKRKSTVDAILSFVKNIYESPNDKKHTISLSIDPRKASDTVCHEVLLKKVVEEWCSWAPAFLGN